jgi:hypothetical protein
MVAEMTLQGDIFLPDKIEVEGDSTSSLPACAGL